MFDLSKAILSGNRKQQEKAFREFFNEYRFFVWKIAFTIINNTEDAKEVTIDTFADFFNLGEQILKIENYKLYLWKMTRRKAIQKLKANRQIYNPLTEYNESPSQYDFDELKSRNEIIEFIYSSLKKEEASIFIRHVLFEMTFKEIATEDNTTTFKISSKYFRAKRTMKKIIEGSTDEKVSKRI